MGAQTNTQGGGQADSGDSVQARQEQQPHAHRGQKDGQGLAGQREGGRRVDTDGDGLARDPNDIPRTDEDGV